eukprot:TRINITY_DN442_c0_g1_i1.p1 TRINITY_DN442_c0_g1~~TRINITY_DN442_c0_g1_i1.p1  ORF type:complete len:498 (-),score=257.37 TRINITY_DN442_c0_g1_i1:159-1652(-)
MSALMFRADRAILKRQQDEQHHERRVAQGLETFKVEQKGLWENKMVDVIRNNRVKEKVNVIEAQQKHELAARRRRLAKMLSEEQASYESEMADKEETPQQRMDKMAMRAYELKKRREDERKAFVQNKLYQQWREGIDELRTMDSKIVELKTLAARDFQLQEKQVIRDEDKSHDDFYDRLWHEGYMAKIEREEREHQMREERNDQQKATLAVQLQMKKELLDEEKQKEAEEVEELKKLWAAQEQEEKDIVVQGKVRAKQERAKADEYMAVQQAQRAEEERLEKEFDKEFVSSVLTRERKLAEMEEAEMSKAKKKAIEYTEALKVEMARKAESDAELVRMQAEETEKQWAKRYVQWEKEEMARRNLMTEVFTDRAEQVNLKKQMRQRLKDEAAGERDAIKAEIERLDALEQEREAGEKLISKRHQEELFRQMDFHQVQRHRQIQQHAIEQRQAAIAEEKIRRAVAGEKKAATRIMKEVLDKRAEEAAKSKQSLQAPWDR